MTADWSAMTAEVKGDAYEGLLEKNAQDLNSGARQYFTPRAPIGLLLSGVDTAPKVDAPAAKLPWRGALLSVQPRIAGRTNDAEPQPERVEA